MYLFRITRCGEMVVPSECPNLLALVAPFLDDWTWKRVPAGSFYSLFLSRFLTLMLRHSSQSTPTESKISLPNWTRSFSSSYIRGYSWTNRSVNYKPWRSGTKVTEDAGADAFHDRGIARSTHESNPRCCISSKRRSNFKWAIFPVVYYSKYTCRMNTTHKSILSRL